MVVETHVKFYVTEPDFPEKCFVKVFIPEILVKMFAVNQTARFFNQRYPPEQVIDKARFCVLAVMQ